MGREATKRYRQKKQKKGLCIQCGTNKPIKGSRCKQCLEKAKEDNRRRRQERLDAGLCYVCGKNPHLPNLTRCQQCTNKNKKWYKKSKYRETNRLKQIEQRHERRKSIIQYYGGKCICCGEDNLVFLALDHIEGGGNQHRRDIGFKGKNGLYCSSTNFYKWVERNNYPPMFQVLCHNCNIAKHRLGGVCCHHNVPLVPPIKTDIGLCISGV